jgi:hypothetical protein
LPTNNNTQKRPECLLLALRWGMLYEAAQSIETDGETTGTPHKRTRPTAAGGFSIDFRNMGVEERRAAYKREERTIYVNLDHPQIAAALAVGGVDDVAFRRLAYERNPLVDAKNQGKQDVLMRVKTGDATKFVAVPMEQKAG